MTDNELILFDRLEVIRAANKKYDLENNAFISFSGGKDSTVLHYLMDEALPGNRIPRVFCNTGLEYLEIVKFVRKMAANDDRFEIVTPGVNIRQMLEEAGYPFKSKEHSKKVQQYQMRHNLTNYLKEYVEGTKGKYCCPAILKYQFTEECTLKISHLCCNKLKKIPVARWKEQKKKITNIMGMQKAEGGARATISCIVTDRKGELAHFHPLAPIDEDFEKWYIETRKIELCALYYPPYNFNRTGCKGCPFALHLQEDLDIMAMYFPNEKKQCEIIWAPVYAEYRRLGYRLRKDDGQISLFDY